MSRWITKKTKSRLFRVLSTKNSTTYFVRWRSDENGNGPAQDLDESIRLYTIAAELGSTNAMNNLGRLYLSEALVQDNKELGLQWLARASERGNRFAPFHLGRIYRNGKLVDRDFPRAIKLFERSADLGFAPASY